jgi:hypothetical protein
LEREGISAEELQKDFVSHQAIHTYLIDARGAEHTHDSSDPREVTIDTIQRLHGRDTTVSESTINNLSRAGHVSVGEFNVITSIRFICRDCESQYAVAEFINRGRCNCEQ